MGREAECDVTYGRRTARRKALLETDELIVRGTPRLVIRRSDITRAVAAGDTLRVAWKGGDLTLALGAREAEKWAHEILHPKTRLDKLGIKTGQRVALVGVKDHALRGEVETAGATTVGPTAKNVDHLFLQADTPRALSGIRKARDRIAPAGGVWVLTPRGVEGLKDTDVMKAGKAAGLVDVKVVRFSDTHSANRFVIPKAKRAKP